MGYDLTVQPCRYRTQIALASSGCSSARSWFCSKNRDSRAVEQPKCFGENFRDSHSEQSLDRQALTPLAQFSEPDSGCVLRMKCGFRGRIRAELIRRVLAIEIRRSVIQRCQTVGNPLPGDGFGSQVKSLPALGPLYPVGDMLPLADSSWTGNSKRHLTGRLDELRVNKNAHPLNVADFKAFALDSIFGRDRRTWQPRYFQELMPA